MTRRADKAEMAKPLLLFCASPGHGHVMPVKAIAKNFVARGYETIFLTGSEAQSHLEAAGITFRPLLGKADWSSACIDELFPEEDKNAPPSGQYCLAHAMRCIFANMIPDQHESIQGVLRDIQQRSPGRKIIIIQEFTFWGSLPIMLGAESKPEAIITLGTTPLPLSGPTIPPFGLGLSYDPSPAGVERNEQLYTDREEQFSELTLALAEILGKFSIKPPRDLPWDFQISLSDRYVQMCVPRVEYPRPDAPPGLRFAGFLPRGHRDTKAKPAWCDDVTLNAPKKRIVAVSQGTATAQWEKLLIPTMRALADCKDILVVAALGREGAALPEHVEIPPNARVADFVPFDELLPYTDVFITNGGYGAFQHAVSHGTPLIVAGTTADKPEVAARVEWAGLGINMRTESPTPAAIREAVERVLADGSFVSRAQELQSEMAEYNAFDIIEENIMELVRKQRSLDAVSTLAELSI